MAWRDLKDYFKAIGSTWVGLMSGIVGLVLLGLGLFFTLSGITEFKYWLFASIICFAIASFRTWQKHRPDLIIEIKKVLLDTNYGGMIITATLPTQQFVSFKLYQCNTKPPVDSVRHYELIVGAYGRTMVGREATTDRLMDQETGEPCVDLNESKGSPLNQGIPSEGWIRFELAEEPRIKGQRYTLTITDAYNTRRRFRGVLPFDYSDGLQRRSGWGN